jgi:hypothetical protein
MADDIDPVQDREWHILHDRITEVLDRYGHKDPFGNGDYWLVDDNWGQRRHRLEIQNPALVRPQVVVALQAALADYPDWEINAGLYLGKTDWPASGMGLVIYSDEIIDELQRKYLPEEFRDLRYPGARRLFDRD